MPHVNAAGGGGGTRNRVRAGYANAAVLIHCPCAGVAAAMDREGHRPTPKPSTGAYAASTFFRRVRQALQARANNRQPPDHVVQGRASLRDTDSWTSLGLPACSGVQAPRFFNNSAASAQLAHEQHAQNPSKTSSSGEVAQENTNYAVAEACRMVLMMG